MDLSVTASLESGAQDIVMDLSLTASLESGAQDIVMDLSLTKSLKVEHTLVFQALEYPHSSAHHCGRVTSVGGQKYGVAFFCKMLEGLDVSLSKSQRNLHSTHAESETCLALADGMFHSQSRN